MQLSSLTHLAPPSLRVQLGVDEGLRLRPLRQVSSVSVLVVLVVLVVARSGKKCEWC